MSAVYTCFICKYDFDEETLTGSCEKWRTCGAEFLCEACCSWVEDDLLCNCCEAKQEAKQEVKEEAKQEAKQETVAFEPYQIGRICYDTPAQRKAVDEMIRAGTAE